MKIVAACVLALMLFSTHASAVTYYQIGNECKLDIDQYCKNIPKIRLRDLRQCLAAHEKDLFPRCKDHYKEAK